MAYTKTNWNNNTAPYINNTNLNHIEQGIYDNDTAITKTTNVIGYDEYDSTSTYNVGDYCIYNNMLFKCLVAITTAEEFNSNHWDATSINEVIKEVESDVATNTSSINSLSTITTGSGTVNTTLIGSVEANHWERVGKVVTYSFVMTPKTTTGNTATFVTGLPKAVTPVRFVGNNSVGSEGYNLRLRIFADGTLRFDYTTHIPTSSSVIEGTVTYMTNDD